MSRYARPEHFNSSAEFSIYVLQCAIRDRTTYLESIQKVPNCDRWIAETKDEIKAIRARKRYIEKTMLKGQP